MKWILLIFTLLFAFLMSVVGILLGIFNALLRPFFGQSVRRPSHETRQTTHTQHTSQQETPKAPKSKVFGEDEGEYVEFEEVKE